MLGFGVVPKWVDFPFFTGKLMIGHHRIYEAPFQTNPIGDGSVKPGNFSDSSIGSSIHFHLQS
jgi:hypothetical protein